MIAIQAIRPRRSAALRALALLPLLLAPLASCASLPDEPEPTWVSTELTAGSERVLWEVIVISLERQGFQGQAGYEPERLIAKTGWQNHLAPFKGRGYRLQAIVEAKPLGAGRFTVQARVRKQTNENLVRPTDPSYAEWEWTDDDQIGADVLLGHISSYFDPELHLEP